MCRTKTAWTCNRCQLVYTRRVRFPLVVLLTFAAALCGCADDESNPVEPPPLEPDPTLERIALGVQPIDTVISIDVPADAFGATIVARADAELGLSSLESSDARMVIDNFGLDGVERYVSKRPLQSPAQTVLAAALPQSDSALAGDGLPGTWALMLGALSGEPPPTEVVLSMWLRRGVDLQLKGQIDVNWFMADGVASDAHVSEVVERALAGFAGLQLGVVERYTLASGAALVDNEEQYAGLVAQTATARRAPALNVIAVSDASGLFGSPVGRAGGIPGLPAEHGSELSAAVIELSGDPERDAEVLRHETGHMGGLFHTSDSAGVDALADTPMCADVMSDPTSCPDVGNVMFPQAAGAARVSLSASQQRVVLASTLFRVTVP
jgi:hypothetical protein